MGGGHVCRCSNSALCQSDLRVGGPLCLYVRCNSMAFLIKESQITLTNCSLVA